MANSTARKKSILLICQAGINCMLRVHLYLFLLYDLYYYSPVPVRGAAVHTTYGKKSSIYRFPFNVHLYSVIIDITSILMTSIPNTTPIYICTLAKSIYFSLSTLIQANYQNSIFLSCR